MSSLQYLEYTLAKLFNFQRNTFAALETAAVLSAVSSLVYTRILSTEENRCLVPRFHDMENQFLAVGCGLGWTVGKKGLGRL